MADFPASEQTPAQADGYGLTKERIGGGVMGHGVLMTLMARGLAMTAQARYGETLSRMPEKGTEPATHET